MLIKKMKFILLLSMSFSLVACTYKWRAANSDTNYIYGLKYGQKYEAVRDVYVCFGKEGFVEYDPNCGYGDTEGDAEKKYPDIKFVTLSKGTRFKATRVKQLGGPNNGYRFIPYAKVLSPSPHVGLELTLTDFLTDSDGRPYPYTYIRKVDK